MKVFISMPMKAKGEEQVKQEMSKAFEFIKEKLPEAELLDSVIEGAGKDIAIKGDDVGVWYLGESIKRLAGADIVFFVNDWKCFRGCSIEHDVALAYGKICTEITITG